MRLETAKLCCDRVYTILTDGLVLASLTSLHSPHWVGRSDVASVIPETELKQFSTSVEWIFVEKVMGKSIAGGGM